MWTWEVASSTLSNRRAAFCDDQCTHSTTVMCWGVYVCMYICICTDAWYTYSTYGTHITLTYICITYTCKYPGTWAGVNVSSSFMGSYMCFFVVPAKRVCSRSSWVNASCTNDATLADCNKPAVTLVSARYAHMYVCMTICMFTWVCERGGPRAPGTVLPNVDLSLGNWFNSAVDLGVSWSSEISAL